MIIFLIFLPMHYRIFKSKTYTVSPIRGFLQPNRQSPVDDKIYHRRSPHYKLNIQRRSTEMY